ncbi:MAG TPA: hypothetical protein VEY51_21180 [Chondromyces sp.]|nr:hypothetical protein [Chondromyces sp.]
MSQTHLLEAYRSIWNNRLLRKEGYSAEEILAEAITRELLDENSHPRIRKPKEEKFYYAIKRLMESDLPDSDKVQLINLHIHQMEKLRS